MKRRKQKNIDCLPSDKFLKNISLITARKINKMTNYERWLSYTEKLVSPDNYIQWGWYSLIASSLQRRVWLSASHIPCYPNMYVILVGEPGIGKGLVLSSVSSCLKYWKREKMKINTAGKTEAEIAMEQATFDKDTEAARESDMGSGSKSKPSHVEDTLLFPVAPDATTYEALVGAVCRAYRRINYKIEMPDGTIKNGIYGHSSLAFQLPELASLLRKKTDDTVNYLLGTYDSPDDYEYDTRSRGRERVRRACINILAGTTPNFIRSTFNSKLIDEGWTSRTFFIYATKNRFHQFSIPPLTPEQESAKTEILNHIRKLSNLYGEVKWTTETKVFMHEWWRLDCENAHLRPNRVPQMKFYYSRKNLHVMKLAMAIHFGESTEMVIPLDAFKKAISILDKEERFMHLAIQLEGDHPVARIAKKIIALLTDKGEQNFVDIYIQMLDFGAKRDIEEALEFLLETDQINRQAKDEGMKNNSVYFSIKGAPPKKGTK